jgi:hypothetical protein
MSENERNLIKDFETVAKEVFDELMAMDDASFSRFIDEHKDGDIADLLLRASAWTPAPDENCTIEGQGVSVVPGNVYTSVNNYQSGAICGWGSQSSSFTFLQPDNAYAPVYQNIKSVSILAGTNIGYVSEDPVRLQALTTVVLDAGQHTCAGVVQTDHVRGEQETSSTIIVKEGIYRPSDNNEEVDVWPMAA